mgnify:CR=1 FL=1|tara:strand:- start:23 stop:919 length:897 start_codon:yes stop_codon:yes gene_type:complete
MALSIVKETIELEDILLDGNGNAFIQKRINLQEGYRHVLTQVDVFEDAIPFLRGGPADEQANYEIVISPYPQIPTNMLYNENTPQTRRYVAGGDDSVMFKANARVRLNNHSEFTQFPSVQIAAQNKAFFYAPHVYINIHFMGIENLEYGNIAISFMMVFDKKKVSVLESTMGVLAESHAAMCALAMSNGHLVSVQALEGNVFPMWRYGGMRPETMISPLAANGFFLDIASRDAEDMQSSAAIRQSVADARQMNAFDGAFGPRRPDWLREFLNGGYESGPIRSNPIPLRYADNGNTRMF